MNRSGSTLQYHIAVKLTEVYGNGRALGFFEPGMFAQTTARESASDNEWLIAKVHDYSEEFEAFWEQVHPKVLYIYRDIRDVVVSLMNMQDWTFESPEIESSIRIALYNFNCWTAKPGVLVSRYEDVMREGGVLQEVYRVAQVMGLSVSADDAERIAASVDLPEQKRYIQTFDYDHHGVEVGNTRVDPQSLLHNRHIHSGAVEQWRTALTPQQIAIVEWWAGDWLQNQGYPLLTDENQRAAQLGILLRLKHELEVSEADRAARLEVIRDLKRHLDASEADRQARLDVINDLKQHLDASEADRRARQVVIDDLKRHLDAREADRKAHRLLGREANRAEKQTIVEQMRKQLEASEANRLEQQTLIDQLKQRLDASEADRAAQQAVIDPLRQQLEEQSRLLQVDQRQVADQLKRRLDASEADRIAQQKVIGDLLLQIDELMLQLRNAQSGYSS